VTLLLCDSGPLIASSNSKDREHLRVIQFLASWRGRLLVPEPVLGETCNFLRNNVRDGAAKEVRFLRAVIQAGDFEVTDPTDEDRSRAAELAEQLVTGPAGYVDSMVIAMAERMKVADIATLDFKLIGMMSPVSRLKPLRWVLQET
jgi:uncharacterized protein